MWRVLLCWIVAILAAFWGYQQVRHPQLRYNRPIDVFLHPFDNRVRYRIGVLDERFGLKLNEVKQLSNEAALIWQNGTGKSWFVYDEQAMLTINLIYDERQAETKLRQDIKQQLDRLIKQHDSDDNRLVDEHQQLNQQFDRLQQAIDAWQSQHGQINPYIQPYEYQRSLNKKQRLDAEIDLYHDAQAAYNTKVEQHNAQAGQIRRLIADTNQKLPPRQFDKGVFNGRQINIYEFGTVDDLRLTLAHEFGHALGLGHHNEPTALMYPMAGEQDALNFKLQPADLALLKER